MPCPPVGSMHMRSADLWIQHACWSVCTRQCCVVPRTNAAVITYGDKLSGAPESTGSGHVSTCIAAYVYLHKPPLHPLCMAACGHHALRSSQQCRRSSQQMAFKRALYRLQLRCNPCVAYRDQSGEQQSLTQRQSRLRLRVVTLRPISLLIEP
jgi:hypothetical protein